MRIRLIPVLVAVLALIAAACSSSADDGTGATPTTLAPAADTTTDVDVAAETTATTKAPAGDGMLVQDGDIVDVHYVGTLDDGSEFDSSRDRGQPLSFTVGSGQVIPGFDEAVRGAEVGEVRTVRILPENAYGEWSEDNIIDVPFNPEQGDVKPGDQVYLTNGQPATVLEVTDENVKLDANHPLAGEALTFEIEVLAITRS